MVSLTDKLACIGEFVAISNPSMLTGGKIGFYYKEHEILPPLPSKFTINVTDLPM